MPGGETDDFGAGPTPAEQAAASSSAPSTNGKYVPPSMRGAGAQASSDSRYPGAGGNRDDLPTLRVTNVSDDVEEEDLRLLFDKAIQGRGRIMRVYVGKDRETGQKKGYAFVTCDSKDTAERAMQMLNGKGERWPLWRWSGLLLHEADQYNRLARQVTPTSFSRSSSRSRDRSGAVKRIVVFGRRSSMRSMGQTRERYACIHDFKSRYYVAGQEKWLRALLDSVQTTLRRDTGFGQER